MLLVLLAAAAQEPVPERFSILVPVAPQACDPRTIRRETEAGQQEEVVVCAADLPDQAVPVPNTYVGDRARPSNPHLTGSAALAAEASPCATVQSGCQVGFGPLPLLFKGAAALAEEVKHATRRRDKRPRTPIDISEPGK